MGTPPRHSPDAPPPPSPPAPLPSGPPPLSSLPPPESVAPPLPSPRPRSGPQELRVLPLPVLRHGQELELERLRRHEHLVQEVQEERVQPAFQGVHLRGQRERRREQAGRAVGVAGCGARAASGAAAAAESCPGGRRRGARGSASRRDVTPLRLAFASPAASVFLRRISLAPTLVTRTRVRPRGTSTLPGSPRLSLSDPGPAHLR